MEILLCSVPNGSLKNTLRPLVSRVNGPFNPIRPVGLLRILAWMKKKGYSADIYDINNLRPSDEKLIENFKRTKPTVVGLGASLSHCYPNIKRITKILRQLFPEVWIVVGGHLTSSSNIVLRKTETDICVIGDGEITFVKLLDYFKLHPTRSQIEYAELCQIKGLAFIDKNHKVKVTGNSEQVPGSEMPYFDYEELKLGLQKYGGNGELIHEFFKPLKNDPDFLNNFSKFNKDSHGLKSYEKYKGQTIGELETARGCVARCTFCQRYQKGYRPYSENILENHILNLKEKYNVRFFDLIDENFGSNRKQSYEVARLMKKHNVFWQAGGVRCTSVTYEDLKFYREHNLLWIKFGIESGSQKILDIMEKKFTTKNVYNAISNCKKLGIAVTPDVLMLAMPGETRETVIESTQFNASLRHLLEMDWNMSNPFLAMAIPGTPLYEYCQQIGVIGKTLEEEEDYLIRMSEHGVTPILNYLNKTNSSNKEVHYWKYLYVYAGKKAYVDLIIKNNKSIKNMLLQIYERCIKGSFNDLIVDFHKRKESYKNKKLSQKMKWHASLLINFLLSLSTLFLPKAVLFPIVRVYADLRFYFLAKNHKKSTGKQKHNLFIDRRDDSANGLRISENRIAKKSRQVERSLRNIVKENREQMRPVITDEEKSLRILAQAQ
jgi:radical SAM superfamily enzyme YgiQ (UPF0313 family)